MSEKVIVLVGGPGAGRFLAYYDPDADGGRGFVGTTDDLAKARRFPDAAAAMEEWRRPSKVVPLRPDGKPNRPLSAWTITVCSPEKAEAEAELARRLTGG